MSGANKQERLDVTNKQPLPIVLQSSMATVNSSSVTDVLLNLLLPGFDTVLHNGRCILRLQLASFMESIIVKLKGRRAG
jgi:hypothetical protein